MHNNEVEKDVREFWEEFVRKFTLSIKEHEQQEQKLLKLAKEVVEKAEANAVLNPKTNEILVVMVEPWKKPYKKIIKNDLETFQEIVEGYIEHITIGERQNGCRLGIILNEEGKLKALPVNRRIINYDTLVGNFFLAALNLEGDYISLTEEEANYFIELFEPANVVLK